MNHMGHIGAVMSIVALLISTAFLIWVGEKGGNTYQKLGKVVGAVALALSALLVIASVATCVHRMAVGREATKGCPMMRMMGEEPGMPGMGRGMEMGPGMGRGMGMHRGMPGPGMEPVPPPPPATPEMPKDAKAP